MKSVVVGMLTGFVERICANLSQEDIRVSEHPSAGHSCSSNTVVLLISSQYPQCFIKDGRGENEQENLLWGEDKNISESL